MEIFDTATSRVQHLELFTSKTESRSVSFESDLFKQIESNQSQGIGLRVINDGKIGFSFSNDFDDLNIIDRALESSQFGEKARFNFSGNKDIKQYKLYDPETENFSIDSMLEIGEKIISSIKELNPEIKVDVGIEKESYTISLKTSNGFSNEYQKSFFSVGANGLLAKNDQLLNVNKSKTQMNPFTDIKEITDHIKEGFRLAQNNASIKTGNYKVLFTPRAFKTLISILTPSLSGKSVQKGVSPLTNKIGEQILGKEISFSDDGTYENGLATAPFDGEGTRTQKNILFEKGILNSFIFDLQTAGLLDVQSTGNGSRGYSSVPSPGFRNLIINPGNDSYESMLSSINEGILVDQFIGAGQSNVMAGEFSMNLALAFKIEKGSLTGRLKDVMVSGNVFDALNHVLGMGNQLHREGSGYFPYILLDMLSISSKQ